MSKNPKSLELNGFPIPFSSHTKYIGVTLDYKLSWKEHVENKIKSIKKLLMMVRGAIGRLWGPTPQAMLSAYKTIIVPSLSYGSLVWHKAVENQTNQIKLGKLNRLFISTICSFRKSTPTAGLEIILNLAPLHLRIKE